MRGWSRKGVGRWRGEARVRSCARKEGNWGRVWIGLRGGVWIGCWGGTGEDGRNWLRRADRVIVWLRRGGNRIVWLWLWFLWLWFRFWFWLWIVWVRQSRR